MKIFNIVKLLEMICIIVPFYEYYYYEFWISNDFYKIVLNKIYRKCCNLLDILTVNNLLIVTIHLFR